MNENRDGGFTGLSQALEEIMLLAGFSTPEYIRLKYKTFDQFLDVIQEFVKKKLVRATKNLEEEKRLIVLGMYSDDPHEFEFLPGQLLELEFFFKNIKAPAKAVTIKDFCGDMLKDKDSDDDQSSEEVPQKKARKDCENWENDQKEILQSLIRKYVENVTKKDDIQMEVENIRIMNIDKKKSGDMDARVMCFCDTKFLLVKKKNLSWVTSNFYLHIRKHVQKLSTQNVGGITKFFVRSYILFMKN